MAERPRLSVVLPAYDEALRIGAAVERTRRFLAAQPYASEVIVVSDGSTDATAVVARRAGDASVRVLELPLNRGKGCAVRTGMLTAEGAFVLFSDVDLSTPLEFAAALLAKHEEGFDVVIGSRALDASEIRVRQAWWRESMGRTFNRVARRVARVEIADPQCGFKSFRRDAARMLFDLAAIRWHAARGAYDGTRP